jgi:Tat protein translocase TatB subunit
MFGIGPAELLVIAVVMLVVVGPQRLPELMKQFGRFFVQARRVTTDFHEAFESTIRDAEREINIEEQKKILGSLKEDIRQQKPDDQKIKKDELESRPGSESNPTAPNPTQAASSGTPETGHEHESTTDPEFKGVKTTIKIRGRSDDEEEVNWNFDGDYDLPPLKSPAPTDQKEGRTHV